jgi:translocator protein
MRNAVMLVISVGVCLLIGFISGRLTAGETETWYPTLKKPEWNPPNWVFFPVWTTLYVLMGIALFLVWKRPEESKAKQLALSLFGIQLFLNFCWSIIFFTFHAIEWALVDIVMLWMAILLTIGSFFSMSRVAAWFLWPYAFWVTFAAVLNYSIVMLNR